METARPSNQPTARVLDDPYRLRPEDVRTPPTGWGATLRQLGPGLILTGSIVGSGELIATTTLGAQVGFAALWLILISCAIKVPIQSELGRYTITSGQTAFEAFDRVPGPRWRASWLVWSSLFLLVWGTIQSGGIIGGTGQSLELLFPQLSGRVWTLITAGVGMVLLVRGQYRLVEWTTTALVVIFTFTTLTCAILLFWTPYTVSPQEMWQGLRLTLPAGGAVTAFAVFGITGVGASELMAYPYWCLEKGYARAAGPNDGGFPWLSRARGWIRVMQKDVLVSMVLYTTATVAFYFLGASVLYGLKKIPSGFDMVQTLSNMYTTTLGPWAFYLFGVGAFAVLFSTFFVGVASSSRMIADALQVIGLVRYSGMYERQRAISAITLILPPLYAGLYFVWASPVTMVVIGGLMQTVLLPAIGWAALHFSRTNRTSGIAPSFLILVLLALGVVIMTAIAVYAVAVRVL